MTPLAMRAALANWRSACDKHLAQYRGMKDTQHNLHALYDALTSSLRFLGLDDHFWVEIACDVQDRSQVYIDLKPVSEDAWAYAKVNNPMDTTALIIRECDAIKEMLLTKNAAYGNSALDPLRIFSRADTEEQIRVRLDDKLSCLKRGTGKETEDVEADIIGYLILMRVHREMTRT